MTGTGIRGIWVERTALYHARRKKGREKVRPIDFEEELLLELSPLPCWAHLSPEEYQGRIRELVEEIEKPGRRAARGAVVEAEKDRSTFGGAVDRQTARIMCAGHVARRGARLVPVHHFERERLVDGRRGAAHRRQVGHDR